VQNPKIYTAFDLPPKNTTKYTKPSRTKQDHREATDIYKMLERHKRTGQITQTSLQPMYGDFSGIGDYREVRQKMFETQEAFDALPSEIRNRFKNDPAQMIDFIQDPKNQVEAEKMGLCDVKKIDKNTEILEEIRKNTQPVDNTGDKAKK